MRGYAGKYLEVDLTEEKINDITFNEKILRQYIGGRGLATKILWDRLGTKWKTVDPLGPENILLALTGPLTGFYPGARLCISGKSPLTNGIVGSTVAGEFPIELKCAGYDGIIITGKADRPVYVFITDSKTSIRDASHLWGEDGKTTLKILTKDLRGELKQEFPMFGAWKEPAAVYIGPAGETQTRIAAVCAKWTHGAGYGGYGGVMGSKNLKALVAKSSAPLPRVKDLKKVLTLIDEVSKISYRSDLMRRWGTGSAGFDVGARQSSEPVRNWQEEWHDKRSFGVDQFEHRVWIKRYWGDFGCPTTCLKVASPKIGPYKGAITDNPDYENQAYLGTNLGIFTPEENVYLTALLDDLGFCTIQGGNVLGFVGELFQRGVLTKEELDGLDLQWGNVEAFATLTKKIANREGIGDLLADGTYRFALKMKELKSVDVLQYAVVEKGMAIGAHGIRSGEDYVEAISYACSVQAGDHTSPAMLPINKKDSELTVLLHDSGVYCWFNILEDDALDLIWDFFEAVTGWRLEPEEWYSTTARRILHLQRVALLLGGPDVIWDPKIHDDNPPRWYEPLPSGPYAGKAADKTMVKEMKEEYYKDLGCDEKGIPTPEELRRLGLEDVIRKLETEGFYN